MEVIMGMNVPADTAEMRRRQATDLLDLGAFEREGNRLGALVQAIASAPHAMDCSVADTGQCDCGHDMAGARTLSQAR